MTWDKVKVVLGDREIKCTPIKIGEDKTTKILVNYFPLCFIQKLSVNEKEILLRGMVNFASEAVYRDQKASQ